MELGVWKPTAGDQFGLAANPRGAAATLTLRVRVEGQLMFNTAALMMNASLQGFGLAYLTEQQVQPYLENGELVRVLASWCPPFPGYHLYYPSRRQPSAAFTVLVGALRYRAPSKARKSASSL